MNTTNRRPQSSHPEQTTVFVETETPLGPVWLTATSAGLSGLWFTDQRHAPTAIERAHWMDADPSDDSLLANAVLARATQELKQYFDASQAFDGFTVGLDITRGTLFQRQVWKALRRIDSGVTTSYGTLAKSIDKPAAVRAVGAAVGRNPISIIVPCHRVLGKDGQLTGYAGGMDRKRHLLALESMRPTLATGGAVSAPRHRSVSLVSP